MNILFSPYFTFFDYTGGIIGTVCGGLGVPGAAIGSMLGTLYGGVAAGAAVNDVVQTSMKHDIGYIRFVVMPVLKIFSLVISFFFRFIWSQLFGEKLEIGNK